MRTMRSTPCRATEAAAAAIVVVLVVLVRIVPSATALGFNCTGTIKTCSALVDYVVSPRTSSFVDVAYLFGVTVISIFRANSLPLSTYAYQTVKANQTIKIPFQCSCASFFNNIGISENNPVYSVKPGDYSLSIIANDVFSGLVTAQDIARMNLISNNIISEGQSLRIPLPCSCDPVDGDQVLHYGLVVPSGTTLLQIANEYGTTPATLLTLNALADTANITSGKIIDVPLRVCKSMVSSNSLDYPLLVPNGSTIITANNCVQCTCDSSKNWRLYCDTFQGSTPAWCSSMKCQGGLSLGSSTMSPCSTCSYAGFTNEAPLLNLTDTCTAPINASINAPIKGNNSLLHTVYIASSAAGIGLLVMMIIVLYCCCLRGKSNKSKDIDIEILLKNNGSLVTKRYTYTEIKKMTDFFKDKLGEGGYGSVFKGKLLDRRLVAVKILNKSKGNGDEFINEVVSISKTSHVNIVSLIGYCFERTRRALVYEFMPNGSLDKFIYNNESSTASPRLGWEKLFNIAIGIGRGLEYLHRGCNSRILHFDIKPHNILLDQDFCPKVSDFGLAKLCPTKDSIISMMGMRGTIGYIAPEVFSRNFGGVSHKSDVYSYGMMVLEMVGGRKNVKVSVDHTSELYFPHWIYTHFQQDNQDKVLRVQDGLYTGDEEEIVRKMSLVGLWCIQTDPSNRPSMRKVVEMLEGNITSLQMPPKPYLCSPPRTSPAVSSSL